MVRSTQWLTSMALGLILAWQGLPAHAQQSSFPSDPTPARLRGAVEADQDDSDDDDSDQTSNSIKAADDSEEMADDSSDEQPSNKLDTPRNSRGDSSPNRASKPRRQSDTGRNEPVEREVIKERFPDGSVKVEREVAQDADANYHNHGIWKTWDQRGNLLAQGEFNHGNRCGTWVRWYRNPSDVPMLTRLPYSKYNGPIISQATFDNDLLDGVWTIYDGKKNKISQWEFSKGKRNGTSIWWHAGGHKMREAQYRDGELHGQLLEWSPEGTLSLKETYQAGHRQAPKVVAKYQDGSKKSEGMYLFAKEVETSPDDWWNCKAQVTAKQGKDERHGPWTTWYSNGQPQLEGNFEHDLQAGQFAWWHQNGQKALEGRFDVGKQHGAWTWWYPSGQKSIRGEYNHGNPAGRWTWWKEDGKVSQSADLSHSEGVVVDTPNTNDLDSLPEAKQPRPRQLK
jgi:antitoxin component YwqK of YwqJK toxin-antitoxin module